LAVPLVVEGQVEHGLAYYYTEPQAFSDEQIGTAISLADQAALAIENARLHETAKELAAVDERQRLARDLHDAVSQNLFSASLIAETLPILWKDSPDEAEQLLEKLRQLNRGALAEMRGLLMELRPAALVETSMAELLRQLGQAVSGREGIPVSVLVDEPCSLPADVHVALYRIAQEALNNVGKHAQASQVDVSLRRLRPEHEEASPGPVESHRGENFALRIRDDGLGFDPQSATHERLGMGIMNERAQEVGATLEIESQVGQGTQVTVVWAPASRQNTEDK
jgi:two-component system nitrate/nitrite sensor histidine kinase NarX